MDCWWYISGPPGKEVNLVLKDFETIDEIIYIYDHPYSTSSNYLVYTLSGNSTGNLTQFTSTRGGLTLFYDDEFYTPIGKGLFAEISVTGTIPPPPPP